MTFIEPNALADTVNRLVNAANVPTISQRVKTMAGAIALSPQDVSGASSIVALRLTGPAGAVTLPPVASMLNTMSAVGHIPAVGMTWCLAIIHAGTGTATVTANTGWTMQGTATIGANVTRWFKVTIASLADAKATIDNMFAT